MNKVLLTGRLTRDPDTRKTDGGISYSRFTLAVDRDYGDQTDFIPIVAWRNTADFASEYLKKGILILVEGRFSSSTYNNNNNERVTRYEVVAERIRFLERKSVSDERRTSFEKAEPMNNLNQDSSINDNREEKLSFAEEEQPELKKEEIANDEDVPWEMDL